MTEPGEPMAAKGSTNSHPDADWISLLARRVVGQSAAYHRQSQPVYNWRPSFNEKYTRRALWSEKV